MRERERKSKTGREGRSQAGKSLKFLSSSQTSRRAEITILMGGAEVQHVRLVGCFSSPGPGPLELSPENWSRK